jgi:putative PEP-CTERM system TPR-repeat lipoprotein
LVTLKADGISSAFFLFSGFFRHLTLSGCDDMNLFSSVQQPRYFSMILVGIFFLSMGATSSPATQQIGVGDSANPDPVHSIALPDMDNLLPSAEDPTFDFSKESELTVDTKNLENVQALVKKGEYGEAQRQAEQFIKMNPGYGPGYEILGLVFLLQNQLDDAVKALEKAIELDRKHSSALTYLGSIYMGRNQLEQAKQTFLKAIERNLNDRFAYQRLGMLCEKANEIDKAVFYFEQGLKGTAPDYIGVKVNLARLYNVKRQFDKTIALLEPVLKPDTKNAPGHILLGTAYLSTQQTDKAMERYRAAAAIDPAQGNLSLGIAYRMAGKLEESRQILLEAEKVKSSDPFIQFELAETANRQGNYQEAQQRILKAIETGYPKMRALRSLAALQMKNKKFEEAIQTLNQVISSKESIMEDQFVLGEALQFSGQFGPAEKLLLSVSKKHPTEAAPWYRLGLHYGLIRDYKAAIANFNKAKAIAPDNPDILKALSLAYLQSGEKDKAIPLAEEVCRLDPKNINNAFFLASLYQDAGKTTEAIKGYKEILAEKPKHAPSLNNLADLTAQSGDLPAALQLANQAVVADPENSRYLDTSGWISFQSGDIDIAASTLEKALSLKPDFPLLSFHLGKVYLQKGNTEKAKLHLQSALKQSTSSPWKEEATKILESIQ